MTEQSKPKKAPSFFLAVFPIISMMLLLGVGFGVYGLAAEMLMITAACIAGFIAVWLGYSWDEIMAAIIQKLSRAMPALFILIFVGFLIGAWMIGGTIPMMVYYGLKYIDPQYIVIAAFIITCVVSLCTGTSWGSAGTVGVALMGVAAGMDAPLHVVAGAVVSGSYFGDKLSPLSDTTNLAPIASGSKLYDHIGHLLYTTVPGAVICCVVYFIAGHSYLGATVEPPEKVVAILASLEQMFSFNLLVILPPIIVLYGSFTKKPTIPVMLISSIVAFFNAMVFQGFNLVQCFDAAVSGFKLDMVSKAGFDPSTLIPDIPRLLQRGGMMSILSIILISFCAYSFAGALSVTGSLDVVLNRLLKYVRSTGDLVLTTIVSCIVTIAVTSNGYLSILVSGEMFSDVYLKMKLEPKNLSRTLEDAITVVEPIIPWTAAGVYIATTLDVPTISYLPWALLCYTGVIFAAIYGYTGIEIAKITEKSEYYKEYLALQEKEAKQPNSRDGAVSALEK